MLRWIKLRQDSKLEQHKHGKAFRDLASAADWRSVDPIQCFFNVRVDLEINRLTGNADGILDGKGG